MSDLSEFIRSKITDVEKSISAREDSEKAWRDSDEAAWKAVGCELSKSDRIAVADRESRILVKLHRELELFKKVLEALEK